MTSVPAGRPTPASRSSTWRSPTSTTNPLRLKAFTASRYCASASTCRCSRRVYPSRRQLGASRLHQAPEHCGMPGVVLGHLVEHPPPDHLPQREPFLFDIQHPGIATFTRSCLIRDGYRSHDWNRRSGHRHSRCAGGWRGARHMRAGVPPARRIRGQVTRGNGASQVSAKVKPRHQSEGDWTHNPPIISTFAVLPVERKSSLPCGRRTGVEGEGFIDSLLGRAGERPEGPGELVFAVSLRTGLVDADAPFIW